MTDLEQAAHHINTSRTGAVARVEANHVSVKVPGRQSLPGGTTRLIFSDEKVFSLRGAIRLVLAMS
jgi:hypothetical protein